MITLNLFWLAYRGILKLIKGIIIAIIKGAICLQQASVLIDYNLLQGSRKDQSI